MLEYYRYSYDTSIQLFLKVRSRYSDMMGTTIRLVIIEFLIPSTL